MRHLPIGTIAQILGLSCESQAFVEGYQLDSRLVEAGTLFFALSGQKTDGHAYLAEASARGAVGAVVLQGYRGPDFGLVLLFVPDVVAALQTLARVLMADCKARLVGITGSLGKTTTKEFVSTLLAGKYRVGKTLGNYNTKLTYPITLLNRTGDEEVLVAEMGMSEPQEMRRLIEIAAPNVAVLTQVARVHIAHFPGGLAEIAREKAVIFSHPKTKVSIFFHGLHEFADAICMLSGERISFSLEDRAADYFLSNEYFIDERGVRSYRFDPPYKQPHILHNFLAAVSVARAMKMQWDEIQAQVPHLQLPKMRFERFERKGVTFVNDAYNANPDSMRAALSSLPEPKEGGKRIAVLGMMVDMGDESEMIHCDVGRFAQKCVDYLLVFGKGAEPIYEGFKEVKKPAEHYFDFPSLATRLERILIPGDVVLIKASRKVGMEQLLHWMS